MPFAPKHAIGKNEWRRSHARNADAFAAQILDRLNVAFRRRLHPQDSRDGFRR